MFSEKTNEIRKDYNKSKIDFNNLPDNPIPMFEDWFRMALECDSENAISFVLSTVSSESIPSSRVVLLRSISEKGFIFFTNYKSAKSKEIDCHNVVSANFFWHKLEKQVRIVGAAEKISSIESDRYFDDRPRDSQLGAWASNQSSIINDNELTNNLDKFKDMFKDKKVDRPLEWGGYCIVPKKIEFWQGRPSRLHDRLLFSKHGKEWKKERLAP